MWSLMYVPASVLYVLFTFLASMVTNKVCGTYIMVLTRY